MEKTVTLDDVLFEEAAELTGVRVPGELLNEALVALIQRESARRLIRLGGSEPELEPVIRRRPESA